MNDRIAALTDPCLAPLFARPTRLGVASLWHGHFPFAHYLIATIRPRLLVEIGAADGVSSAAFGDAILGGVLDTQCLSIKAGPHDDTSGEWRHVHDARYASFSTLSEASLADALAALPDGGIDILHLAGGDRAAAYEVCRPKLSTRAVVLLHGITADDAAARRFWDAMSSAHPSFAFLHAGGLGMFAPGDAIPPDLEALFAPRDPAAVTTVRDRFSLLGERWAAAACLQGVQDAAAQLRAQLATLAPDRDAIAAELASLRLRSDALTGRNREARIALAQARYADSAHAARLRGLQAALDAARAAAAEATAEADLLRAMLGEVLASGTWRLGRRLLDWRQRALRRPPAAAVTVPAREHIARPSGLIESPPTLGPAPADIAEPDSLPPLAAARLAPAPDPAPPEGRVQAPSAPEPRVAPDTRPRSVLFISGEPHTPGHGYRVLRPAALCRRLGWAARWSDAGPVGPVMLAGIGVLVLWRCPWSPHLQGVIDLARAQGAAILFDVDDLMFRPELARIEIIDGIRSQNFSESETSGFFGDILRALRRCDRVTTTTAELGAQLRAVGADAMVVANGFDAATLARSRHEYRVWCGCADGLLRLGYAGGSRTHQRDFAQCVPAVAALLRARTDARLVLFRDPSSGEGLVLTGEFTELADVATQIEWRDMVPHEALPRELVRFDINLAPLEHGNPFCEAKSELKYFEAALAGVPTIASPTGPFRRAIEHGVTGLLAADTQAWSIALHTLAEDPAQRRRLAQAALHDVLWRFGPEHQAESWRSVLDQLGGGDAAARAFELDLRRGPDSGPRLPVVPQAETLFAHDALGDAAVTVIIPCYNYADFVIEALESVKAQTMNPLDLVVIDDCSTDDSQRVLHSWMDANHARFNRALLLRHTRNAGLGFARNGGFAAAETPYVLPLDADNRLLPECCAALHHALSATTAAFAYPQIEQFGDSDDLLGRDPFTALRFVRGNYVDAMALIGKWAWAAAGGYDHVRYGWEDYDFWCRLIEKGLHGMRVPRTLAQYRVHPGSMLHVLTELRDHKPALIADLRRRHPWTFPQDDARVPAEAADR